MKIIHTADIHLDSPLSGVSNPKQRRFELLQALRNLSEYSNNNGVEAVIVAGDLFDDNTASEATVYSVADIINGGNMQWFVLRGNHGDASPYIKLQALCDKVKTFGEDWTSYSSGNVTICGRELGFRDAELWQSLSLDSARYNILVLHGDVDNDAYGLIDKKAVAASKAKYVALGHRHSFSSFKFGKVPACYCGTLEARGFDEQEKTGFVLIDTDTDEVRFIPQAIRRVETKRVDVSKISSDIALEQKLLDAVGDVDARSYLNVELVGAQQGLHPSSVANSILQGRFFALRVADNTTLKLNLDELREEVSLRGEFVRLVQDSNESDDVKRAMLKLGLSALGGEEAE